MIVVVAAAEAEAASAINTAVEEVEEAWAAENPEKATGLAMGKRWQRARPSVLY